MAKKIISSIGNVIVWLAVALCLISAALSLLALTGCGGSATAVMPVTKTASKAVTFYGDSITQFWNLGQSFPGKPYANDGHFGFTAFTLAADFDSSVLPTHPQAVIILAGTNDVLQGDTAANIFATLMGMYAKAKADGLPVVVCTLPPMAASAGAAHNAVIVELNGMLRTYAASNNVPLADYYSVLADSSTGELKAAYSADNVHLTQAGYDAITPVAAKAIAGLL